CRTQEPRDVACLLAPAEDGFFEAIPVSDKVNKVANGGPDIQAPVSPGIGHNSGASQKPAVKKKSSKDDSQFELF
ncbi:MAG: SOS response-associated peptidase, partial [Chloroflexota bacterium]